MGDTRNAPRGDQTHHNGPPPGTVAIVEIYADTGPGGGVEWSHKWKFADGSLQGTGAIDIPEKKNGQDGTPIHFILHDNTQPKVGLTFVEGDDAIWVDRNACPRLTAASDPEITGIDPSGRVLKVLDLNQDKCTLHYNLRFEPDPSRYYYDPEIRNGGTV